MNSKNIVITGGASGIGLATVKKLLIQQHKVTVLDIQSSAELNHLDIIYQQCDLSQSSNIESCFKQIKKNYGHIDCLINNAGILSYGDIEELSIEEWDKVMSVNVRAPFICAKQAIPMMNPGGIIINVASIQSLFAQPKVAAYATSKAAILGLTRAIAIDFAGNIRCVSVCPGTIDTPMLHRALEKSADPKVMMDELNSSHLTKRIGKAEEVAELIVFLCGDECQFINGTEIRIDGGLGVNLGGSID